ncbi:hypothetical protein [Alistipes intestinihominis]|uniref:Uncharacterized protein n=1 Tax=Alistipes intestinihominis TaxID=3133172 RepID=A0ABV1GVT2_9BACT
MVLHIRLQEALEITASQSLDAIVYKDQMRMSYWQYRNYKADLRPAIIMDGTLPSLNKSLTTYQKSDGSYEFIPNSALTGNIGLAVSQNIQFTGGKIYLQSQIERIEQLDGNKKPDGSAFPLQFFGIRRVSIAKVNSIRRRRTDYCFIFFRVMYNWLIINLSLF